MADPARADTDPADPVTAVPPRVEELAERVAAARSRLLAGLAPLHSAAGVDDEAADAFRASHDPYSQVFATAMQDLLTLTGRLLDGVAATAPDRAVVEAGDIARGSETAPSGSRSPLSSGPVRP